MNKNNFSFLIVLVALIFITACQDFETNAHNQAIELFDIKPIVQKDISYNQQNNCTQKKVITINNKQDILNLENIDWAKDLQILLDADINKKDWQDKFQKQTDTINNEIITKYSSFSKKIPVKKMLVISDTTNNISSIHIERMINGGLFSSEQVIDYIPTKQFSVKSIQKAFFTKDFKSDIEIYFIRK